MLLQFKSLILKFKYGEEIIYTKLLFGCLFEYAEKRQNSSCDMGHDCIQIGTIISHNNFFSRCWKMQNIHTISSEPQLAVFYYASKRESD